MKLAVKLTALALAVSAGVAQATSVVSYSGFGSTTGLTMIGSTGTAVTSDGTVLRVTSAAGSQSGAAYSTSPITLGSTDIFSTQFQFRFTNPGGIDPADGITFVLAASPSGLGSAGVGMGYSGVGHSVAVEFDTYNNAGFGLGNNDGNSSNHVSVDTNGILTNTAITNVYGNGSCGFPSGSPSQNNYNVAGCMSNGDLWTVNIGYDGTNLSVSLIDAAMGFTYNAINSLAIDITSLLGTNQAYVGFTSGTGAGWENHDIVNWKFADTTQLAPGNGGSVPEPATLALIGLGLAGIAASRSRKTL
jgi:hypothetical protein